MKTRMELWRDYRNQIRKNMALKEAIISSDDQIKHIYEKIKRVFPKYEDSYRTKSNFSELQMVNIRQYKKIDTRELEKIIDYINSIDLSNDINTDALEKIDFSSHDMTDVIEAFSKRRRSPILELNQTVEIKTKFMKLGKEKGIIMKKIRIAIDGPSGSGKTTVARELAKRLEYKYISTGLVYRAIALNMKEKNISIDDKAAIINSLEDGMIQLLDNEVVYLNNKDVTNQVRSDEISQLSSKVSAIPEVRDWAKALQIKYGKFPGTIMDGRDTTFNIMPDAELKIFLDTTPEVRAQRRVDQNMELGFETNYNNILKEIKERDYRDRNRETDPLHATEDAITIDATNMTVAECVDYIMDLALKALQK